MHKNPKFMLQACVPKPYSYPNFKPIKISIKVSQTPRSQQCNYITLSNSNISPSQVVIVIFWQKQKNPSPTVLYLRFPFIPSWEKSNPRAHICMQRSAAHPSKLEEVEGYKKFVFPQES
jgi:hypothetical protein